MQILSWDTTGGPKEIRIPLNRCTSTIRRRRRRLII